MMPEMAGIGAAAQQTVQRDHFSINALTHRITVTEPAEIQFRYRTGYRLIQTRRCLTRRGSQPDTQRLAGFFQRQRLQQRQPSWFSRCPVRR